MSATFTPGPWRQCGADKVSRGCTCRIVWSVPADANIATAFNPRTAIACVHGEWGDGADSVYGEIPAEQVAANARLIAAAPDLLAALAELIAIDEWMVLVGGTEGPVAHEHIEQAARRRLPAIEAARAAIAKATGGAA